ncbi:MAG: dihydrodipicolinate synthase family protein [Cypionkella sp.]
MRYDHAAKPQQAASVGGIIAAILTPVTPDLNIDLTRLVAHARSLLAEGCTRVSTFGSTGEGVAFSTTQKREAHRALIAAGIAPDQILPAVMATSVATAAEELADLAAMGCRHVLVLPPFYYRTAPIEGLVSYFEAIYQLAGRPAVELVLYNIPAMSGVTISHELVQSLQAGCGAPIAGVKDSTGNIESGLAYVKAFPDLAIFTGDDRVLPHLLSAGGAGMIGGLPNLYASDLVKLYGATDPKEAERLATLAAERIVQIDANGGITALKRGLAASLDDPQWQRCMPPLDTAFRAVAIS